MTRSESRHTIEGRPAIGPAKAESLAARLFGQRGRAVELPSDRDRNFRIDRDGKPQYVLKIANADVSVGLIEAQVEVMRQLVSEGLPVPEPLPILNNDPVSVGDPGRFVTECELEDGGIHLVWLVRWMPGSLLGNAHPVTRAMARKIGVLLGRTDRALQDYDHPAAHRRVAWDVRQAEDTVSRHGAKIKGRRDHDLVTDSMRRARELLDPVRDELRTAVIHGDANDFNILVGDPANKPRSVTGLIDFGDLVNTFLVANPAIAATYVMMHAADPVDYLSALAAGYHDANSLTKAEISALYPLVLSRLCISVCMSAFQQSIEPENAYLRVSQEAAWRLLETLQHVHPRMAEYRIRHALGLEPVPHAAAIRQWIKSSKCDPGPVLDPNPRTANITVFDFSVGSSSFNTEALTVPGVAESDIVERMKSDGSDIGVGRYGEARLAYTGPQYSAAGNERRTIHIGLDLIQPAGAVVRTPLDGIVHSFRDTKIENDYGPCLILEHAVPADDCTNMNFWTLYGHLSRDSLRHLAPGKSLSAGDPIGRLGTFEENGGWAPHLHFQIITDLLDLEGAFPGVAAPSVQHVWRSLCPDPNLIADIPGLRASLPDQERRSLLDKRRRFAGPSLSLHYDGPLHIVRGQMQFLFDGEGRRYLDAVNNVAHVGHANPRVVAAESRQAATLNTNTRYLHGNLTAYAERLTETLPAELEICYFVNSGSEANDLAVRIARAATGRRDIIVLDGAYHGHLSSLIELSPYKFDGPGGQGRSSGTHVVPMPDPYRGPHRGSTLESGRAYAEYVREACKTMNAESEGKGGPAAFLAESVPGCGGQIVPPPNYLKSAADYVRRAGGLVIIDEVQVGMGRPGDTFWGFHLQDMVPDIVVIGKPIGNGHPLGAVVTTRELADAFDNGMEYFNTFGGNPVSCAVGLAVLDEIRDRDLQRRSREVGNYLKDRLAELQAEHPIVGDVRGIGLFMGVELVRSRTTQEPADREADYVINRMADAGVLLSTDGPFGNVIKIKPPLVFSEQNADRLVNTLADVLTHDFVRARIYQ